jgi:hypothetical protein
MFLNLWSNEETNHWYFELGPRAELGILEEICVGTLAAIRLRYQYLQRF